jgi:hypothetical protein
MTDSMAVPPAEGPRLAIRVGLGGLQASLDGEPFQSSSIEELHEAASGLASAGGTATITIVDIVDSAMTIADELADTLQAMGVPTRVDLG